MDPSNFIYLFLSNSTSREGLRQVYDGMYKFLHTTGTYQILGAIKPKRGDAPRATDLP